MPPDDDLRRGLAVLLGERVDRRVAEDAPALAADGAPRLGGDLVLTVVGALLPLREVRVQLDLVQRGHRLALCGQPAQVRGGEVADADRAPPPVAVDLLERVPGLD